MAAIQPCINEELPALNSATNMGFKRFFCWLGWLLKDVAQAGDTVVRQLNHNEPFNLLLRTNRAVMLTVLWVALAACVVGSVAYDVADWVSAW